MIALGQAGFSHDVAPVFVDVELVVAAGEAVMVSGAAGAGSSTLVELLTGRRFGTGRIALAGRDLGKLRESSRLKLRRRLGVVPQELALFPGLTAAANVAVALEVAGVARRERDLRARAALDAVDVPADRAVAELSMAARQRVAWARAFVRKPDILICDQPTCHQDGEGAAGFVERVAELVAGGCAAVVLGRDPHLLAAAGRAGWRALVIHDHRLIDPATIVADDIDAGAYVEVEIERPVADDAIPNVVPFPVARSAGNRR